MDSRAPSTTTYTYDTSKDPRGVETSRTDSVAGTFAATYDSDGELSTESLPGSAAEANRFAHEYGIVHSPSPSGRDGRYWAPS
ncbi:hypothetical protein ACFRIB_39310 [Streptomyces mirabilis]|uniref:hypothetical protein n=1 Tax=Streptomyces mirabilis TaxID=68239 RepID=UPI00369509A6